MKVKIKTIIVMLIITMSVIVIIPEEIKSIEDPPRGDNEPILEFPYIVSKTENLSNIINDPDVYPEGTLAKGRAYGSIGEHKAAEYISDWMEQIGLWGPTLDSENSYFEKMTDITQQKVIYKIIKHIQENPKERELLKLFHMPGNPFIYESYISITEAELKFNDTKNNTYYDIDCFIKPIDNGTVNSNYDESYDHTLLTHNFTYNGVKVVLQNETYNVNFYDFIEFAYEEIMEDYNFGNDNLSDYITSLFEDYYNFTFDNLNPSNGSTFPSFIDKNLNTSTPSNKCLIIEENIGFNPNYMFSKDANDSFSTMDYIWEIPVINSLVERIIEKIDELKDEAFAICYDEFIGSIKYDYDNESHDVITWPKKDHVIFINRTDGMDLIENRDNYKVDFYVNQTWDEDFTSYNVIGQLNGTDPDLGKTIIICSLYDSAWCQGTADAAIGMSIVLALAKYMKELDDTYGIKPKYNVKFIGFGGEEEHLKGPTHYSLSRLPISSYENIKTVIDLNQICFRQKYEDWPPLIMHVCTNKHIINGLPIIDEITKITNYEERSPDDTYFHTGMLPNPGISNVGPFSPRPGIRTVTFLKDFGWVLHHRDGMNHMDGDAMAYFDPDDVNLTCELIWNVSKFFCYYPDCWFDGDPVYTLFDSADDTNDDNDCINVSFSVDTIMPEERVSVRFVLYPKFTKNHPSYPFLYRYRDSKEFIVTPDGVNGYFNVTLPNNFPAGEYVANLYLCNSTGEAKLNAINSASLPISGVELVDSFKEEFEIDILEDLELYFADEIWDVLRMCIVDFIKKLPDIRLCRQLLVDLLGHYIFKNDKSNHTGFELSPPNDPPNQPDKPIDLGEYLKVNWYKTKTTDPDPGDKIRFQWNWNGRKGIPTIFKYDSGEYNNQPHKWWDSGEKTVKVRAKNPGNPNYWSEWSEELPVEVSAGCFFNIFTSQASQSNINNPYVQNSFNSNVVVANQNVLYEGYSVGLSGTPSYTYDFSGETARSGKTQEYDFDEIGEKYINLTVTSGGIEYFYNTTVDVVNTSACFNMSQFGARSNHNINFKDTTISNGSIVNWSWDFDDGNISYEQNPTHNYSQEGIYNVTLSVLDSFNETSVFWQIVHVEPNPPEIVEIPYSPLLGTLGCNITLNGDFYDNNESGINTVYVNISYPDGRTNNYSMYDIENSSYGYEYVFNDTVLTGWYYYTVFVTDNAGNSNYTYGCSFQILPAFGYPSSGIYYEDIEDRITGSNFTVLVNGSAESISTLVRTPVEMSSDMKCMIYRVNDSKLIGTTEEKNINTDNNTEWITFNFSSSPNLYTNVSYVLVGWSDDTCYLYFDNASDDSFGRYKSHNYGASPPSTITWDGNEPRMYSVYCSYSTNPEIKDVSYSPDLFGFGFNTTINAEVDYYYTIVDEIMVNVTYPDNSTICYPMIEVDDCNFQLVFNDSWYTGGYNFSIWVEDELGGSCSSSLYSFNVSSQATISVCTLLDEYKEEVFVNLTDPPVGSPLIGYEFLDDDSVLHIWNKFDSYYFDTDSGIQLTNHKDEYWSHNVLMLGYYNNDVWNLMYRTDELSGFTKDIDSDDETYVEITMWKDLNYNGYDFRLAIRYYIGVDDNELTVTPYIKNLDDEDIPYVLGFGWEMKDIQVDGDEYNDYIYLNNTLSYYLNQTCNNSYTNLSEPIYWFNSSSNQTEIIGYSNPAFYLMENVSEDTQKSLYLRWDKDLVYKLQVKSRDGQYNAPVTLFIRIGTLDIDQEKYTDLFWYDADQSTYYFDDYDSGGEEWATNPSYMVDGDLGNFSSTDVYEDVELCDGNSYSGGGNGTISKVEIRGFGYGPSEGAIIFRPVFNGSSDGDNHIFIITDREDWSSWFDITSDSNAPDPWSWGDISDLDCDVVAAEGEGTFYCSKVEIRVTYSQSPVICCPVPSDGATNVSISPILSVNVSDANGDLMNITWYSNSSGSWISFGANTSVSNGTYSQVFSNASVNGQWWYWKVVVYDGAVSTESDVYKFYTGVQSKIVNTGSYNISGFLYIVVEYLNGSIWELDIEAVNETTMRVINISDTLALDLIFNGLVNVSDLTRGDGSYRVYAAFRDEYYEPLVCDDDSVLEAWWEFEVNIT